MDGNNFSLEQMLAMLRNQEGGQQGGMNYAEAMPMGQTPQVGSSIGMGANLGTGYASGQDPSALGQYQATMDANTQNLATAKRRQANRALFDVGLNRFAESVDPSDGPMQALSHPYQGQVQQGSNPGLENIIRAMMMAQGAR